MAAHDSSSPRSSTASLTLLALGVVFGDIGTSPLYAVKETFSPVHGIPLTAENVLGGLSTMFWALMIVVSLKYVVLIMRADNKGEGGIMALIALAQQAIRDHPRWKTPLLLIGSFGAALFYGDAVLTPAISVLSAVEGLEVGTSAFKTYVVPIAVGVLIALFAFQARGTAAVGKLFGPITIVWFLSIGAAGLYGIVRAPAILAALNPYHAMLFLTGHGTASFVVLGSVVLAVTGAEALYGDMGHFGKGPIRIAWFSLVAPALVLNYFGQGALLMLDPEAHSNPFYLLLPGWALYPMVALATVATVIAAQAVISGTYSLTKQAVQLSFLPRHTMVHTSAREMGQVYLPVVNWVLCALVIAAVIGFGSSSRLAGAYGVAVTATMLVDTLIAFLVIRYSWGYPLALCIAATGFFAVIDFAFFAATLLKIADGGWFPLAIGAGVYVVMLTWRRGREALLKQLTDTSVPLAPFLESQLRNHTSRAPGTAVYLTSASDATPHSFLNNLHHNGVLHERVVFLTVQVRDVPWVPPDERVRCEQMGGGCWRVRVRYGFMDRPDVAAALDLCAPFGLEFDVMKTSFFVTREKIVPTGGAGRMARWRSRMFAGMSRNSADITDYFNIPTDRVIELGARVQI